MDSENIIIQKMQQDLMAKYAKSTYRLDDKNAFLEVLEVLQINDIDFKFYMYKAVPPYQASPTDLIAHTFFIARPLHTETIDKGLIHMSMVPSDPGFREKLPVLEGILNQNISSNPPPKFAHLLNIATTQGDYMCIFVEMNTFSAFLEKNK